MGLLHKAKKSMKKAFFDLQYIRHKRMYYKRGYELYKNENQIPKLSKGQIKEIKEYWNRWGISVPVIWHRFFYAVTGEEKVEYLPQSTFVQEIKNKMNAPAFANIWGDKAYTDFFLRDVKTAQSVVRNINGRFTDEDFELIDLAKAQEIMNQYDELVVKPSTDTHTGNGVKLLHAPFDLSAIAAEYKKNYVIQIPIKQHQDMARLNASSVNTIRVNSVLFDTEAYVMSAFVKVGQTGAFADNHGNDRFFIGICKDGTYMDYAIDHDLKRHSSIPSGFNFAGRPVPHFEHVCNEITKAHKRLPHFGLAYWDVSIDEFGDPVVVEVNLRNPSTNIAQVACGPFFGEYTNQVMDYIFRKQ